MWQGMQLLALQGVPTLTESAETVKQIGLANTLTLILVLFVLAFLAVVGWQAVGIMRSIAKDNTDSAKAQAVILNGQQHIESKIDTVLQTSGRIEGKLDRVLDRRT